MNLNPSWLFQQTDHVTISMWLCGCAVSDMTSMYWLEVGLLPNETMTTQEREAVDECVTDRCSYLHR